ncbi:MAG TPA: alpha-glucan family phosphorylase, partial [Candidatus Dormibacteraeota bacterium]|nr:alpha-glucan family phosphorylase [Candidatus Dormibacteraeota bacterium]
QRERAETPAAVAYFSPEFGLTEALPQYSGGLGVLAGDHLKAGSDLGVPLVGIGLLYREGYGHQVLDASGWQNERFRPLDPAAVGLHRVEGVEVRLDLAGQELAAGVWRAAVGRVPLYLLDTSAVDNPPALGPVTDRLYGGDMEHRLRQEILLGIGGMRALRAVGEPAEVFHTNEGHAGFLGLERIRELVTEGLAFTAAVEAVRASTVFTTHTPVPAGIDRFPRELMERYFGAFAAAVGVSFDQLMAIGHAPDEPPDAPFNMAVMGLRLAGHANGVSRLHGAVSRRVFHGLWPETPEAEIPIGAVTNGVHAPTWTPAPMDSLLRRHVGPAWADANGEGWSGVEGISDAELWAVRVTGREALVQAVRHRLVAAARRRGAAEPALAEARSALAPEALTIGFARRVAEYKRAGLLLSQPDRLRRLLLDPARPLQLVFAGKAHPADRQGKAIIQELTRFTEDPAVRARLAFLEDYDMGLARALYRGADVWLNTPRRPLEACGTSGMKATLNGALNCSIRDGWWDECAAEGNGWSIPSAESVTDLVERDRLEADALFQILEQEVVPQFYERDAAGIPHRWTAMMRTALRTLGPRILAARMVKDYVDEAYLPAARRARAVAAEGHAVARRLGEWKARVAGAWPAVAVLEVTAPPASVPQGQSAPVQARVRLGALDPAEVVVELVQGPLAPDGGWEASEPPAVPMAWRAGPDEAGLHRYEGPFRATGPGRHGYTVRVRGHHPDLLHPHEIGCCAWAAGAP